MPLFYYLFIKEAIAFLQRDLNWTRNTIKELERSDAGVEQESLQTDIYHISDEIELLDTKLAVIAKREQKDSHLHLRSSENELVGEVKNNFEALKDLRSREEVNKTNVSELFRHVDQLENILNQSHQDVNSGNLSY